MNIQTVEQKTGLTKRMIRHYEEFGLIKPKRDENNYREYSQEDIDHLLCIKAMREVGFSLEEIGKIIKGGRTEDVLRRHLSDLLNQQQESYLIQKERILMIKQLLNSKKDELINNLLDQIASAYSPRIKSDDTDDLEDFLRKHHVVHGHIKPIAELEQIAAFDFKMNLKL
jgi:DNA-binding transcriptional MerR regulator